MKRLLVVGLVAPCILLAGCSKSPCDDPQVTKPLTEFTGFLSGFAGLGGFFSGERITHHEVTDIEKVKTLDGNLTVCKAVNLIKIEAADASKNRERRDPFFYTVKKTDKGYEIVDLSEKEPTQGKK